MRPVGLFHARGQAERPLELREDVLVARPLAEDAVVDELTQWPESRVLVGDPGQQQLFQPDARRLRLRPAARERRRKAVQDEIRVATELAADVAERHGHGPARKLLEAR